MWSIKRPRKTQIPGLWNVDVALMRTVRIRERQTLEIRADAFNVMNHPNASQTSGLHTAMNDPLFGTITTATDPSILQFSLKLKF